MHTLRALLSLVSLVTNGLAVAAGPLTPSQRDAHAILVVEVSFVPYGNLVLLREALRGDASEFKNPEDFLGPCLPSKALVREWADPAYPDGAVYRAAIENAGYASVLFLQRDASGWRAICDRHDARHWEHHPAHAQWRKSALNK